MLTISEKPDPETKKLKLIDKPIPNCSPHEVLIKVKSIGVNRPDILQKKGLYPPPKNASPILGLEASGLVEKVGNKIKNIKIGEKVCALTPGGAYAEKVIVPASHCFPIPDNFSFPEAASLPESYMTVWANLIELGKIRRNQTLLIHGGSSGIGIAAIQLAKWRGLKVFTTVRNKEKMDFCKLVGADLSIIYKNEDFMESILNITSGKGVNVILDMVGGEYTNRNLSCLAKNGKLIQIAFLNGKNVNIDLFSIIKKKLCITGSTMRSRTDDDKERLALLLKKHLWPEMNKGKIKPYIYKQFKFEQVNEAHDLMETSTHCGKIILNI